MASPVVKMIAAIGVWRPLWTLSKMRGTTPLTDMP